MSSRSVRTAVDACLEKIDRRDGALRAWVYVDREGAQRAADSLDATIGAQTRQGPLHGVTVALKDIFDAAGMVTTSGAAPFAHRKPERDAPVVAALRAAGAVILGKTVTTEFAFADPSVTRNPWNLEHTPGGSSSGSAAAVAAGMAQVALGSQTIGSTIRPAGYCGVVGFKGTYGRISTEGVTPLSWSLDHVGIFARSVDDAARVYWVLAGEHARSSSEAAIRDEATREPATREPATRETAAREVARRAVVVRAAAGPAAAEMEASLLESGPPRLGVPRAWVDAIASPDVRAHLDEIVDRLRKGGARIVDVALPTSLPRVLNDGRLVLCVEAAAYHSGWFSEHASEYGSRIRELVESGLPVSAVEYIRAHEVRYQFRREMLAGFGEHDALLLPSAPTPAPPLSEHTTGDPVFCAPWTFAGFPAIALPSGLTPGGLPFSIQLIGPVTADAQLLEVARWCEGHLGFPTSPPL